MRAIAILDLVRRLLALEAAEGQQPDALPGAAERVLDRLRLHMSVRIGQEGYRTLLARALTLTTVQFPHMKAVHVATDGSLTGLGRSAGHDASGASSNGGPAGVVEGTDYVEGTDHTEGAVALVAQLLALLITFIGEDLTLRMVGAVSPGLAPDDADSGVQDSDGADSDDMTGGEK